MPRSSTVAPPLALALVLLATGLAAVPPADPPAVPGPPVPPPDPAVTLPPPLDAPADVASYRLDVRLDSSHRVIEGTAEVHWVNPASVPATDLWWHLYMNAFANNRTLFMRTGGSDGHRGNAPGAFGRVEVSSLRTVDGDDLLRDATSDPEVPDDATQLRTPLPRAVPPGGALDLRVAFRVVLPAAFARTGYWRDFVFAGQWFPKLALRERGGEWAHFPYHYQSEFYADFGRYDVTLTVPRGDVVGATGVEDLPVVRLASGDRHHYLATHVHDFAWTAWRDFRTRIETIDAVRVRVLFPPGLERVAERNLAALRHGVPDFAARFGSYPYPALTVVIPPPEARGVEGMEYPTLIATGGAWLAPAGVRDAEYVTLHEYAHQYFYGLLASDEWTWPVLDEGVAEYATGLAMEDMYPGGHEGVDLPGLRVGYWAYQGALSAAITDALPVARPAAAYSGYGSYGAHVYRRTATALRTLELTFGRAATARALALYTARYRFRHPTPADLLAAVRAALGPAASETYLRPALFADAGVDYAVDRIEPVPAPPGQYAARVYLRHTGALAVPLDVALDDARGARAWVHWDGAGTGLVVPYRGTAPLRAARIDPDARVPLDRDRLNNARAADDVHSSLLPLTHRVAYWLGVLLRVVGP